MKVGRGLFDLMSKSHRKCTSRGRSPFLCTATLIVLALSLILAGCGDISLSQLLESEEPGEFRLSPEVASIPVDSSITVEGKGGFKPYTYELVDGEGEFDPKTGKYDATGTAEVAVIEGTDGYGQVYKAKIHVVAPLFLKANGELVSTISIVDDPDDNPVELEAEGGDTSTSGSYKYYVNGTWAVDTVDGKWDFDPPPGEATYTVEVEDDLGNSAIVTVVVVGPALAIDPVEKQVIQGASVYFTGLNVDGTAVYTASPPDAGLLVFNGHDAEYTADKAGTVTITLTDEPSGESVTATLYVLPVDPGPLEISPSSATLRYGDTQVFEVSGGVPPYTFWLWYWGNHGKLEKISDTEALYTAPSYSNTTDWVWVRDSAGTQPVSAKVKVKKSGDDEDDD